MVSADPMANKRFELKPKTLEQIMAGVSKGVDTDKHLSDTQACSTLDAYFTCTICLMVVEEPKECQDCN